MADGERPAQTARKLLVHATLITVAVLGLAGLIYLGLKFRQAEPDYYQPARTALITARERLDASFSGEVEVSRQLKSTRKELEAAITALDQAAIHAGYRRDLEALRRQLRRLEDPDYLSRTSPEQLQQAYREIGSRISALIDRLDSPPQAR